MRLLRRTGQFKHDVKRQIKRGKDLALLKTVVTLLAEVGSLADTYHDHALIGGYRGSESVIWNLTGYSSMN